MLGGQTILAFHSALLSARFDIKMWEIINRHTAHVEAA
jgi:hypothetical protein